MIVLGLTGTIGSGKSEAAQGFRSLGCPIFDADAETHRLLADDPGTIFDVAALFPQAVTNGVVDRGAIAERVFANPQELVGLEALIHPKIRASAMGFLDQQKAAGARLVVLELPLLYETGMDDLCSSVAVVAVTKKAQEQRVLGRPGMTEARLDAIRARQLGGDEKASRADFIIDSMTGKQDMVDQIKQIVATLEHRAQ